jgi:preprotein translocase subunit YajC
LNIIGFLADAVNTTAPTSQAVEPPFWAKLFGNSMFPLILGVMVLFMIMSRSKKGTEKQRLETLKQLKRGDRVQTIGGILGTVLRAEENRVEVKVDETNNTKMWFTRNAIHRIVEEDKADVKAS